MSCEIAAQSNKNDCAMLDKIVLNIQRSADSGTFPSVEDCAGPKCTTPWHGHGVVFTRVRLAYVGQTTHVGLQRCRDGNAAIFLLVVLDHGHQGAAHCQT